MCLRHNDVLCLMVIPCCLLRRGAAHSARLSKGKECFCTSKMDDFGFGVLGGIFSGNGPKDDEIDTRQKSSPRSAPVADYTPPDIANFQQLTQQKQQKNNFVDTLIPVKVGQIINNIGDGNQKFVIYNQNFGGVCIVGQVQTISTLTSGIQFHLIDETGDITVNYTSDSLQVEQDDYVQVVGAVVVLTSNNFYIEAQHVLLLDVDAEKYQDVLKYHNVTVANVAFHLDIGAKLKLQNKHSGKISDLPGRKSSVPTLSEIAKVELDSLYDHIVDPVERLVVMYLKSRPDTLAKRSEIITCLGEQYVGELLPVFIIHYHVQCRVCDPDSYRQTGR